ncbi:unnamed protein product [Prunus armeniaca]
MYWSRCLYEITKCEEVFDLWRVMHHLYVLVAYKYVRSRETSWLPVPKKRGKQSFPMYPSHRIHNQNPKKKKKKKTEKTFSQKLTMSYAYPNEGRSQEMKLLQGRSGGLAP